MKIRRILLTTDLSDNARGAYRCAANLASNFDASLHLVHFAGAIPSLISPASRDTLFDTLETALADEAGDHPAFAGVDATTHLQRHRWTRTRQRTLERKLDIDLIVMSPQGRTGLAKMLLGSFADRIVRHSSVPVLIFRAREHSESLSARTVLVPHDFYDRPHAILPAMRWLDSSFNSAFHFLHVYDPSLATSSQSVRGMEQRFAVALKSVNMMSVEERFAKLVDEDLHGLDVTLETAQGFPSQQVVQRANQPSVDLVLLGKRDGLGSVARSVTREAKCSVLTIPSIDQDD